MTLTEFLSLLKKVKRAGKGHTALCPAHNDKNPSLSITQGSRGKILIKCFAGCLPAAIMKAVGRDVKDLFPDKHSQIVRQNGDRSASRKTAAGQRTKKKRSDRSFELSFFKNCRDTTPTRETYTWLTICESFKNPAIRSEKDGRLFSPAIFDPPYRSSDNVQTLSVLGFDIDHWTTTTQVVNALTKFGRVALIHSTHSHLRVTDSNPEAEPRFRVIIPLSRDVTPEEYQRCLAGLKTTLGLAFDEAPSSVAQMFHTPAIAEEGDPYFFHVIGGEFFDPDDLLPEPKLKIKGAKINGSDLLDEIWHFVGRFVSYPSEAAHDAHVLWIAHAWLMDYWDSTPRLAVLSPEPGSGKSRVLEVTEPLVPRAIHAVNVSPAYLFRKISDPNGPPTILYDEIDTVFGPKAKDNEDIRGMLNAGHRKGAMAGRCVIRGKSIETEELPAYCAVALAGLNDLPDTLMTRSVVFRMRRCSPNEHIEPWRQRKNGKEAEPIAERLEAWAGSITSVKFAEPPPGIEDRNADVWEPLLTVAELVGGNWPERARVAAVALVASAADNTRSLGVQLLADLKIVFNGYERLQTDLVIEELLALPESPWGDLRGKELDARGLSFRLRKYDIKPKQLRIGDRNVRGYERSDLEDSWSRYLPTWDTLSSDNDPTSATSATTQPESAGVVSDGWGAGRQTPNTANRPYDICENCLKHRYVDKPCPYCND